jgi:NAD(P)-dependent dehydrogenase (short-subunit alcohol dehydrogenase family)
MDLNDKVAFITGGASGLGLATAQNFIAAGAKVLLYDQNEENANKAADELGANAIFAAGDVASEEAVKTAIQKCVDAFGTIHIDVNCAGIGFATRTVSKDGPHRLDVFETVLRINLLGTFNTLRLCAEVMQNNEPTNEDGERRNNQCCLGRRFRWANRSGCLQCQQERHSRHDAASCA